MRNSFERERAVTLIGCCIIYISEHDKTAFSNLYSTKDPAKKLRHYRSFTSEQMIIHLYNWEKPIKSFLLYKVGQISKQNKPGFRLQLLIFILLPWSHTNYCIGAQEQYSHKIFPIQWFKKINSKTGRKSNDCLLSFKIIKWDRCWQCPECLECGWRREPDCFTEVFLNDEDCFPNSKNQKSALMCLHAKERRMAFFSPAAELRRKINVDYGRWRTSI